MLLYFTDQIEGAQFNSPVKRVPRVVSAIVLNDLACISEEISMEFGMKQQFTWHRKWSIWD